MKKSINLSQRADTVTQTYEKYQNYVRAGIVAVLMTYGANGMAQEVKTQDQTSTQTEVVEKPAFSVHGTVNLGDKGVAGESAQVVCNNLTFTGVLDVSHNKSGVGLKAVRMVGTGSEKTRKIGIINPYINKKFGENDEIGLSTGFKYLSFDEMPEANGFTSDVTCSWTGKNGLKLEGAYIHNFIKDNDSFRVTVNKKIGKALSLTLQGWCETHSDIPFYGSGTLSYNLGNNFNINATGIIKDGKNLNLSISHSF